MPDTDAPDDVVRLPIWPFELTRALGTGFFSLTQMAKNTSMELEEAREAVESLERHGLLQAWLAPKCLTCGYLWPAFPDEESVEPEVCCPMCNAVHDVEDLQFYRIYEMDEAVSFDDDDEG